MNAPALVVCLALAVTVIASGAVAAFSSPSALKKLAAIVIALTGAALALALLQAPSIAVGAAVAIAFAYAVVGVALIARLQEAYGGIDADEFDAADQDDEPRGAET